MPRPRARSLFELDGQWIAAEPDRPSLYRFWNDAGTGRTRRESLGTEDLQAAKVKLAEIVLLGRPKTVDSKLKLVLETYHLDRTDHLVTADGARHAGRLFLECWGELVSVSAAISIEKQRDFVKWSIKKNHALGYIARNMVTLAAALAHSKIAGEVMASEGAIRERWPDLKFKPRRKAFTPSDEDIARIWAAPMPEALRRWITIEMSTGARPEAALDLIPECRDKIVGAVDLNPPGRIQNKKFRPKLRETSMLKAALDRWEREDAASKAKREDGRYVGYASVDSVDTALWRVCMRDDVAVPRMGVYSFRHKIGMVMRLAKVPPEQRSLQKGHRRPDTRVTDEYGDWHPSYLAEATAAIEAWNRRILKLAKEKRQPNRVRKDAPATSRRRAA